MDLQEHKRLLIYHHYDRDDMVDPYVEYALAAFRDFGFTLIITSNSALAGPQMQKLRQYSSEVILRENRGLDWGAWKGVLLGKPRSFWEDYDEVAIANSSFYGPLFPLEQMYSAMSQTGVDFWAPTMHTAVYGFPEHIQPYFCVFSRKVHGSDAFWRFWEGIDETSSDYWGAVWNCEIRLTTALAEAGFSYGAYARMDDTREVRPIGVYEPFVLHAADWLVARKCLPFIKYKAFYKLDSRPFSLSQFIFRALRETGSAYPPELIINHLRRTAPLSWHKNLPGTVKALEAQGEIELPQQKYKVGVFAHFYYPEMIAGALAYLENIPCEFDLYITTKDENAASAIRQHLHQTQLKCNKLTVKAVDNRGRDFGAWLTNFQEEHLQYDIALKLHNKKHSQISAVLGEKWNDFLWSSVLESPAYVARIISNFAAEDRLGMVMPIYPPLYNMIYPQGYWGCPEDQQHRDGIFKRLGISPPPEQAQYILPAGGIFWYRPKALRRLITAGYGNEDFPAEPLATSGTIGHGLERAYPYVAQCEGYHYQLVASKEVMYNTFLMYEDRIMSTLVSPEQINAAWGELCRVPSFFRSTGIVPPLKVSLLLCCRSLRAGLKRRVVALLKLFSRR